MPPGTGGEFMTGGDANGVLCGGTPHGLKITTEGDEQFLYHVRLLLLLCVCVCVGGGEAFTYPVMFD